MKNKSLLCGVFVLLIAFLFTNTNTYSQKLYIKGGLGYSIGTQKDFYKVRSDYYSTIGDSTTSVSNYQIDRITFGQGANYELTVGGFVGKSVSVELTGFYHSSNTQTTKSEEKDTYENYYINFMYETNMKGKMFGIKPSVLLWLGSENFRPYFSLGAVIGYGSFVEENELNVFNTHPLYYPTETLISTFEYKGNWNVGYTAGAGFEINFANDISFYCELNYTSINVVPQSGKYTKYEYRGNDMMELLSTSEIEYEYVDEYSSTDNSSENSPTKVLKTPYSFSNVGVIVGLKFNLIN